MQSLGDHRRPGRWLDVGRNRSRVLSLAIRYRARRGAAGPTISPRAGGATPYVGSAHAPRYSLPCYGLGNQYESASRTCACDTCATSRCVGPRRSDAAPGSLECTHSVHPDRRCCCRYPRSSPREAAARGLVRAGSHHADTPRATIGGLGGTTAGRLHRISVRARRTNHQGRPGPRRYDTPHPDRVAQGERPGIRVDGRLLRSTRLRRAGSGRATRAGTDCDAARHASTGASDGNPRAGGRRSRAQSRTFGTVNYAPETLEGWYALHQIFRTAAAVLACPAEGGWTAAAPLIGSRADVMLIHFRPTLDAIGAAQRRLGNEPFVDRSTLV